MGEQLQPGAVLVGKYRVERLLGEGGMGYVAVCTHLQLQERVALKFLHPELATEPEVVTRFLREAQAAARIRSEHIVRVHDVGTLENGSPYMVMEYLQGTDLAVVLQEAGPLPVSDAVDYLLEACEALAQAHAIGIVHRDLKPANLFLAELPGGIRLVKVLDFGISKINAAGAASSRLTSTKAMLGTPCYMAPEQLTSTRGVDARADIWALGIVLYELLTGAVPFSGETLAEICVSVLQQAARPIETLRLGIAPELGAVIERCLQKDREHRFAHVGDLAVALAPFGSTKAAASAAIITRILPVAASTGGAVRGTAGLPSAAAPAPGSSTAGSGMASPIEIGSIALGRRGTPATGGGVAPEQVRAVSTMTGPTSWARTGHRKPTSRLPIAISAAAFALVLAGGAAWWAFSSSFDANRASVDAASSQTPAVLPAFPVHDAPPARPPSVSGSSAVSSASSVSARIADPAPPAASEAARPAAEELDASAEAIRPSASPRAASSAPTSASRRAATSAPNAAAAASSAVPRPAPTPKPARASNALDPSTMIDDRR